MILGIDASRAIKKEKTGVEWYSYFLLRAMERCTPAGWQVRLYAPTPPPQSSPIKGEEAIGNSPPLVGGARGGEGSAGNWQWRVLKWIGRGWTQGRLSIEMMKAPPDVLFVPSHVIPLVHPERTITTVHDIIFVHHPELYASEDLEMQKRGLEFALKFAKKIIVPSRATRDDVVANGGRPEQVAVVPHGVELGEAEKFEIRDSKFAINSQFVLFIGRIEKKKNVLGLIHAFRIIQGKSPDLKLVLAGPLGFGGEDVIQAIKTFKLTERVIHLGYVSRQDYLQLLSHASLLIVPSFGEGFGMPVLEAMTTGVPVICSDIPSLHEVGGNAVQYVVPHLPEDIARGVMSVLQNEMLQSEMVRRGKERAREYTWEKAAQQTWNAITSL